MSNESESSPFDEFPTIPAPIQQALSERGFKDLTLIQRAVLNAQADGRNLRLSSQTGSGKTVALGFALAKVLLDPEAPPNRILAVTITPTRELAMQVKSELDWLFSHCVGVRVDVVTGGTDLRGEKRRLQKVPRVLVATPGRLLDHIRTGAVDLSHVREVVLDEADQMLDMGFRDDLDAIVDALPKERRSHLVSATFPANVLRLAQRFQQNALQLEGTALGEANQDIEHIAHVVYEDDRYKALVNVLLSHLGERALVFVRKRSDAAEVAEELANEGFAALPLSGDMAQAQRQRALSAFKSGTVHVLIATDVAARGIHVDDIAVVVHFDVPTDAETYTHRSGRTGRAGNKGCSVSLIPARGERRAQRLLRDAQVNAVFAPLPNPKKIRQRLVKDARRRLHTRITNGEAFDQTEYAVQLLAQHPPEVVVAALLEMAETPMPREPFELGAPPTARDSSPRPMGATYVRFSVTWGGKQGANVNRLLSHVCRRSGLNREAFGVIDVGGTSSTVDVRTDLAEEFASKVKTPDDRDPSVRISRISAAESAAAGGGEDRRRGPSRPYAPRGSYGGDAPRGSYGGDRGGYQGSRAGARPNRSGGAEAAGRGAPAAARTRKAADKPA